MSTLRAAVVGVGYLGRFHAEKYRSLSDVALVGVCDIDTERGVAMAEEQRTRFFPDHRHLVGLVDAVTVAASTGAHFELARFFLEHGVHVLVEKPITRTSREARQLAELAEQRRLKLQVGHVERFNPTLLAARESLSDVRFVECHRLAPFTARGADVNVILDLMIHDLDVILSLIDAPPVEVSAVGTAVLTDNVDIANARIVFGNGAIANVTASRVSTGQQRRFRVFQPRLYVSMDFGKGELRRVRSHGAGEPLVEERTSLDKADALLAETRAFVDAIRDDTPCVVSGWDGVAALELAEAVVADIERRAGGPLAWG